MRSRPHFSLKSLFFLGSFKDLHVRQVDLGVSTSTSGVAESFPLLVLGLPCLLYIPFPIAQCGQAFFFSLVPSLGFRPCFREYSFPHTLHSTCKGGAGI